MLENSQSSQVIGTSPATGPSTWFLPKNQKPQMSPGFTGVIRNRQILSQRRVGSPKRFGSPPPVISSAAQ
jgi:hypothetical protein